MPTKNLIIIHCSATPNGRALGGLVRGAYVPAVEVIDQWHAARKFQRDLAAARRFNPRLLHVGYQFVIDVNGSVQSGRAIDERGAHTIGYNAAGIGVCMVGTDAFTLEQWLALNLPNTSYRDLTIAGNDLIAGSYGRGIWVLDDVGPVEAMTADSGVRLPGERRSKSREELARTGIAIPADLLAKIRAHPAHHGPLPARSRPASTTDRGRAPRAAASSPGQGGAAGAGSR